GGRGSRRADGKWTAPARQLLEQNASILAPDVFLTGEYQPAPVPPVDAKFAGFTFGYNRPLLANRVHDILTAVAYARGQQGVKKVDLAGFEQAGPWGLLARALCGDAVAPPAADVNQFRFDKIEAAADDMMLPGALRYGGLPALAALCAPGELCLHNHQGTGVGGFVRDAYQAAGKADRLHHISGKAVPEKVVQW